MARIEGVNLPDNKKVFIGLTYIYGIGRSRAMKILELANIDPDKKVKDLTGEEITKIRKAISDTGKIEGDLRKEVSLSIKRLMEINCYRGIRHKRRLPVRGQRNARTRKGPRRR